MNEFEQIKPLEGNEKKELKEITNIKEIVQKKEEQNNPKIASLPNWSIEPPIEISRGE